MRTAKGLRASAVASILLGSALAAGTASAQASFTIHRPSSILIYPKVINALGQDTVIEMANNHNMPAHARCFYTNGAAPNGVPLWTVTDFDITLTRMQATQWLVSTGRRVNPVDDVAGFDPGLVPPTPPGFTGSLVCAQVDAQGGDPVGGNYLSGNATIGDAPVVDNVSKYSAIGIEANPDNVDGDNVLKLDNFEFAACPGGAQLNFPQEGTGGAVVLPGLGAGTATVSTTLTFVPCDMDFENAIPSSSVLSFEVTNELEEPLSGTTTVTCWDDIPLSEDICTGFDCFGVGLRTPFGTAEISFPVPAAAPIGAVGVASVLRVDGSGASDTAMQNLIFRGNDLTDSLPYSEIRLP